MKPKPIVTSFHLFSRTLHWPPACAFVSFDWFTGSSVGAFHYAKPTSQRPNHANQEEWLLPFIMILVISEFFALVQRSRAVNRVVKIGMASFGWNILNEIGGSPESPPVILEIPVGRNRNRPFQLTSYRDF